MNKLVLNLFIVVITLAVFALLGEGIYNRGADILPLAIFLAIAFSVSAVDQQLRIKREKLTTYKSNPRLLFPSVYFKDFIQCDEQMLELENDVLAEAKITGNASNRPGISESSLKLADKYEAALRMHLNKVDQDRKVELKRINNRIELCRKAVECERRSFLTDNGERASTFTMNRQNEFTNFLLTGVTVPLLLGIINTQATSIQEVWNNIVSQPVMRYVFCSFIVIFSYRIYKYFRNKHSWLTGTKTDIVYTKAEFLIAVFDNALKNLTDSEPGCHGDGSLDN